MCYKKIHTCNYLLWGGGEEKVLNYEKKPETP